MKWVNIICLQLDYESICTCISKSLGWVMFGIETTALLTENLRLH